MPAPAPELVGVAGEHPYGAFQYGKKERDDASRQQQIGDHRGNPAHAQTHQSASSGGGPA